MGASWPPPSGRSRGRDFATGPSSAVPSIRKRGAMVSRRFVPAVLLFGLFASTAAAQPSLTLEPVASVPGGFRMGPTVITHAGDGSGRLFIAGQDGTIHVVRPGDPMPRPFLQVPTSAGDET